MATRELLHARRPSLATYTVAGEVFEMCGDDLRCTACAHRCVLQDGSTGVCGVRTRDGKGLRVPYGYVARRYVRAVETNTLFHVRPGARALTFGMYGCDLRCGYCHNHRLSQALREPTAGGPVHETSPEALVSEALDSNCSVICAAYNEPMITAEWVRAVFAEAKRHGLVTALISDGHSTVEAVTYMKPVTDVFRVDVKGFSDEQYRSLGGRLRPVLETLMQVVNLGYWVEVVTLVVPGFNDDPDGLRWLGDTIRDLNPYIPWHLNAFQPRYRMLDRARTNTLALMSFAGTAYARGLRFVYVGNVATNSLSTTRCPECHGRLIERRDWQAVSVGLDGGRCPTCSSRLPGLW